MKVRMMIIPLTLVAALAACEAETGDEMETTPGAEETAELNEPEDMAEAAAEARELSNDASMVLQEMQADADLAQALEQAHGVLVVPHYGRAGAVVGASGGEGVLMARRNGEWSDPGFYDIGGISVGAQFGGEGGAIALLLMSDAAVNDFMGANTFSLDAQSGLTIIDYSAAAKEDLGTGDIVMWSDLEGAFAGVTLGANAISWDEEENQAYYGRPVTPQDVINGNTTAPTTGGTGSGS